MDAEKDIPSVLPVEVPKNDEQIHDKPGHGNLIP
jgi:hypothetical protein